MPMFNVHYHQQVGHELREGQVLVHSTDAHDAKLFVETWLLYITVTRVEQEGDTTPRPRSETVSLPRDTARYIAGLLHIYREESGDDWFVEDQQALDKLNAALNGE